MHSPHSTPCQCFHCSVIESQDCPPLISSISLVDSYTRELVRARLERNQNEFKSDLEPASGFIKKPPPPAFCPWKSEAEHREWLTGEPPRSMDLSYGRYFTEISNWAKNEALSAPGFLYRTEFAERVTWAWLPSTSNRNPPIKPPGQIESLALSSKSATLIRRAGNLFESEGDAVFITLTYSESVCQRVSKKHLDNFLKALRRQNGEGMRFFWVAELQKRGVIHYHICTTYFTEVAWLVRTWRRITGQSNLEPDVRLVNNPGKYMAKYMSKGQDILNPQPIVGKRCGFDRETRKKLEPVHSCRQAMRWLDALPILETMPERHQVLYVCDASVICEK